MLRVEMRDAYTVTRPPALSNELRLLLMPDTTVTRNETGHLKRLLSTCRIQMLVSSTRIVTAGGGGGGVSSSMGKTEGIGGWLQHRERGMCLGCSGCRVRVAATINSRRQAAPLWAKRLKRTTRGGGGNELRNLWKCLRVYCN